MKIRFEDVTQRYDGVTLFEHLHLEIPSGKFFTLLGPSGCGKTTLLRMLAGFVVPDAGRVWFGESDVTTLPVHKRGVGMVFQDYALFPDRSALANVMYGLDARGVAPRDAKARALAMLGRVGLADFAERSPATLSGGQRQRVAMARALVIEPRLLLLDEPLAALDVKLRVELRAMVRDLQVESGITTVFVTHDQEEALSISDRIVVMNAGRADQIGTPFEIYNTPATRFVASFVGTLNLIEAKVVDPDKNRIVIGDQGVTLKQSVTAYKAGDTVSLALRPEAGSLAEGAKGDTALTGDVTSAHFLGSVIRTRMNVGGNTISFDMFNSPGKMPPAVGERVTLRFSAEDLLVIRD
jgi:putative spermidine/putrescine transport system ATP-binding protein